MTRRNLKMKERSCPKSLPAPKGVEAKSEKDDFFAMPLLDCGYGWRGGGDLYNFFLPERGKYLREVSLILWEQGSSNEQRREDFGKVQEFSGRKIDGNALVSRKNGTIDVRRLQRRPLRTGKEKRRSILSISKR